MNTAPLKADQQAADRLLKAAVGRAVEMNRTVVRTAPRSTALTIGYKSQTVQSDVIAMLATAGRAAALLLDERPAKKAAARKGAS